MVKHTEINVFDHFVRFAQRVKTHFILTNICLAFPISSDVISPSGMYLWSNLLDPR